MDGNFTKWIVSKISQVDQTRIIMMIISYPQRSEISKKQIKNILLLKLLLKYIFFVLNVKPILKNELCTIKESATQDTLVYTVYI